MKLAAVAHQAAGRGEIAKLEDRRHRVADRQGGELPAPADEKRIVADHQPAGAPLGQRREGRCRGRPRCLPAGQGAAVRGCGPPSAVRDVSAVRIGRIDQHRRRWSPSGTSSRSSSSRLAASSTFSEVTPVRLPPGRFRLATSPSLDRVARGQEHDRDRRRRRLGRQCRGSAADVASTFTRRRTSSAANAGSRSYRPSAQRYSKLTSRPSTWPVSLRLRRIALRWFTNSSADAPPRYPITGIAGCCARALHDHAAATPPPTSAMNFRRPMPAAARIAGNRIGTPAMIS